MTLSLGGFICTRSEYNAKGQPVKTFADTGADTTPTAATLYKYDFHGQCGEADFRPY